MTLERQVHFVCGKGGVGKSTVACALALLFREQGHRVLLAQVNAADSHARLLDVSPIPDEIEEIEDGLFAVNMTPEKALREYVLLKLKLEALYRLAVENRVVQRFLRFIPSMAELNMLGKIWFHAEEQRAGARGEERPRFDRIVVDCPSTGHGLGFLRVSQVVRDVVRAGPVAVEAGNMARTFADPERTRLHVVTLPEDMPTNETLQFVAEVRRTEVAPLGYIIVNSVMEPGFAADARAALSDAGIMSRARADQAGDDENTLGLARVLARRLTRDALTAEQLQRLRARDLGLPVITLPLLLSARFGRDDVRRLADEIAEAT